jgi:hypothetical protein
MALGHERAHLELFRQVQSLPVGGLACLESARAARERDLAMEAKQPGFAPALTTLASQRQRLIGESRRFLHSARQEIRLGEPRIPLNALDSEGAIGAL